MFFFHKPKIEAGRAGVCGRFSHCHMGCGSSTSAQPAKQPSTDAEATADAVASLQTQSPGYTGDVAKASVEKAHGTPEAAERGSDDEGGRQASPGGRSSLPPIKDAIGANRKAPPDPGAQEIAQLLSLAAPDALDQGENATDIDSKRHTAGEEAGGGADSRRSHDHHRHRSHHGHHHHGHGHHHHGHKHRQRDEGQDGGGAGADEWYAGRLLMFCDTASVPSSLSLSIGSSSTTTGT